MKLDSHKEIKDLQKKYGKDVITRAVDGYPPVEAIPTGCFAIDRVIGCGGLPRGRIIELYGEPSCQPAGEKVLMSDGEWKNIEDIKIGDKIISPQRTGGTQVGTILNTTRWEASKLFEIVKKDGDSTLYRCSGNHIVPHMSWINVKIPNSRKEVTFNQEIERTAQELYNRQKEKVSTVFTTPEITWGNKNDPSIGGYTLGMLLSDGNITGGSIRISSHEDDMPKVTERMLEEHTKLGTITKDKRNKVYTIGVGSTVDSPVREWLKETDLQEKNGHHKFIPKKALLSSVVYRRNLLAGLIDGDGSLHKQNMAGLSNKIQRAHWEYTTVSKKLAEDVKFLVFSLGGYCSFVERETMVNGKKFKSFRLYISMNESLPVSLPRKFGYGPRNKRNNKREKLSTQLGFRVKEKKGAETVYGFTIDTPSQWYITNNFVVTHNSGKTASSLYLISEVQKQGGTCAFIDAEYSFNGDFATSIGVDTKELFVSQPATLEEGADILRALIASNQMDLIIVDSVAALVPKREVEGEEMLANSMAVQAQLMSKMLRVLTGEVARSKTVVIFINHLKERMGVFWGDKSTTPGGKSLKFFASVRLAVSRGEKQTGTNDEQIGSVIKIVAQKNKVAPPWRKGVFTLFYATGVDHEADTFDTASELGTIGKSGNTYSFGEEKLGVGRKRAIKFLKSKKELHEKIREITKEAVETERKGEKS